ncbi:MAG: CBS domain-containing protein, partial [Spirochaetales bacterium]|nr:CBS domain-containing protein [Spirochaetales bacterium]
MQKKYILFGMQKIPINTYNSPTLILELIYKLKVKEVMSPSPITASPKTTLRSIQKTMREKSITGVPISEGKRLLGIISMDDIIQAMDHGYIEDTAGTHMSTKLIVLEDDMPISFAITYFDRYPYHRFPVLNKNKELVGIVTSRDITTSLLLEINSEIDKIERVSSQETISGETSRLTRTFTVLKNDLENAGLASTEIKKHLKRDNADPKLIRRAAIAAYELEINLVVHADGGEITAEFSPEKIIITARDLGPGIPDVELAMEEGYS